MSDIVERLRHPGGSSFMHDNSRLLDEAADEIERRKAQLFQIIAICDDNASVGNTALALKYVREIASQP